MDGRWALGARFSGGMARILFDRLEETIGRALPRTPELLADPRALSALLRRPPGEDAPTLPAVRAARLPGVEFESSNCRNFLIEVELEDGADAHPTSTLTLYAKVPCAEKRTRAFAHAVGFWEVEVAFCRGLAGRFPIRVPKVYAAAQRGARFVLLLENLQAEPGVVLFVNRDMAAGTTPDRARQCLRTFADLHAAFWGLTSDEREELLPLRLHTYLRPGGREMTRALNEAAIAPARAAAPDLISARVAEVCERALSRFDDLIAAWHAEPLTLVHGDSHLANCFEYETATGPRMGMIDFQGMHWGHGIRDVQYFLINSLEPDVLAAHEDELLAYYIDALAERGIALDAAEAWSRYRALSFQTLMVGVVSLGLGALTERDDTVRTVLRRGVAAIERLDFDGWLRQL